MATHNNDEAKETVPLTAVSLTAAAQSLAATAPAPAAPSAPDRHTIKQLAAEDRPREKMLKSGPEALTTAELFAILIGSGTPKASAVVLMQQILDDCHGSIAALNRLSVGELKRYNGIGDAKALTIIAACELSKRRVREGKPIRQRLDTPQLIYEHLLDRMQDLDVEEAFVVLMNHSFKHIRTVKLSHGGLTETAVDVRLIIKEALLYNATVVALAHNHPSGNVRPSRDDDALTKKVADACAMMRIYFLDHLVITDGEYYSYREAGKL